MRMKGEAAFFGLRTLMCKKSMACLAYGTERPLSLMTASSWAEGCEIPRRSDRRLQIEPIFRGMSPLPGGLGRLWSGSIRWCAGLLWRPPGKAVFHQAVCAETPFCDLGCSWRVWYDEIRQVPRSPFWRLCSPLADLHGPGRRRRHGSRAGPCERHRRRADCPGRLWSR